MMGGVIRSIPLWIPIGEAVYGIAGFADIFIFNVVEFWTGSNPLAITEGEIENQLVIKDGKTFNLIAQKNKFTIQELKADMQVKASTELIYDEFAASWVAPQENGEMIVLNTLNFDAPDFLLAKN